MVRSISACIIALNTYYIFHFGGTLKTTIQTKTICTKRQNRLNLLDSMLVLWSKINITKRRTCFPWNFIAKPSEKSLRLQLLFPYKCQSNSFLNYHSLSRSCAKINILTKINKNGIEIDWCVRSIGHLPCK